MKLNSIAKIFCRILSFVLVFVLATGCFSAIAVVGATTSEAPSLASGEAKALRSGNEWTFENNTLKTVIAFESGSISMKSFYNKSADREYLSDNDESYLFSYTYGEYINGTVWSLNDYKADGSVPSAGKNSVTLRSDDGSWSLGKCSITDIKMTTDNGDVQLGKQVEITVINEENAFENRMVFSVYDGDSGFHYQNYVKNTGDEKMVITDSDVISLSFPGGPHYLNYVNAKSSTTGGAENSTWKTSTGGLPENTGRNALNVYTSGDGFWIMPETNWRTQDGPDVSGSKSEGTKSYNEFATTSVSVDGSTNTKGNTVKVACVGDSITHGSGATAGNTYPQQLAKLLGDAFEVVNYGVGARTLLNNGDYPYSNESVYTQSLEYQPDIVIIMLGTNDSKPQNWAYKNEFKSNYIDLINSYKALESNPEIYVATSPMAVRDSLSIVKSVIDNEVVPLEKEIADETGCEIIDINALTQGHDEWYTSDGIHPNDVGYSYISDCFSDFVNSYSNTTLGNMTVKVSTNPQSMQLTLKSGEEFQYIGVNLAVFKGDIADGKMAAEEHFQKRYEFHDTSTIINTNDWDYIGKRSYNYFEDVVIPQAQKANIDMVMIDDLWNTDRDSLTSVSSLKSLSDISSLIDNSGMKFGLWYSLTGGDHNNGRDLADPQMISEKKEQIRSLITDYGVDHQMIDLTEFWQNKSETSYSSPCDNVYRKNVLSNQMLNELVDEFPQYMVKLTNEVDVYPTQGNRNTGLLHLVNNGWIVTSAGVSGLGCGANNFGYLPLSSYYNGGAVNGSMSLYYNYMFARNTKLNTDPAGSDWTDSGVELMNKFNTWRKSSRINALTDLVKRPTYLGEGWSNNWVSDTSVSGPYSWMYTSEDKSRALMISTSYTSSAKEFTADTRWLDSQKAYYAADITLDDTGDYTYKYLGVYDGADLTENGFSVDLTENTSGGKAIWFEEVDEDVMQVVYADENASDYSSKVSDGVLNVTVNGTPGTVSTIIVANSADNTGRICPVYIGEDGTADFSVTADKLYAPDKAGSNVNLGSPVRIEYENMYDSGALAGSSSNVTFAADSTDASPSGGKYGIINFGAVNDFAELSFDVPSAGQYNVELAYKINEKCAKVSLGQNGQRLTDSLDQSIGSLNTWGKQSVTLTFDKAGINTLQVFYDGKGANTSQPTNQGKSIRVDYIEFTPKTAADSYVIEAEDCGVKCTLPGNISTVSGSSASGGKYLKVGASSAGTEISLPVQVEAAGYYDVTLNYMKNSDGGRLNQLVNDEKSGNYIEQYSATEAASSMTLGAMYFDPADSRELSFIVAGRSSSNNSGYSAYFDSIVLTPSPAVAVTANGGTVALNDALDLSTVFSAVNMQSSYCKPETITYKIVSESVFDTGEISGDRMFTANSCGTAVIRGFNKYDLTSYCDYTLTVVPADTDVETLSVILAINCIGAVSLNSSSENAIVSAEKAYSVLTDFQKQQVSNYYLLKSCRNEYDILKKNASSSDETKSGAVSYVENLGYLYDGSSKITPGYNPNGSDMQYIEGGTVYEHGFGFEPYCDSGAATGTMIVKIPDGADKFYAKVGLGVSASKGNTYDQKNVVNFKINGETAATTGLILKNYSDDAWVDNTSDLEFAIPDGAKWLVIENYNGGINHADHIIFTNARFENTGALLVTELISNISPENVNISEFSVETAQKIDAAEKAYYALDNESRAQVTNAAMLTTFRQTHAGFGLSELSDPELKSRIEKVNSAISVLPTDSRIGLADMGAYLKAAELYDALSESERYYVGNINAVMNSKEYFETVYSEETLAVKAVCNLISALLPLDEVEPSSVAAARNEYDKLADALKPNVYNYSLLEEAENGVGKIMGDVDGDGNVSVSDVVALRKAIMSGNTVNDLLATGDLDKDGKLSVSDVVALRKKIMQG